MANKIYGTVINGTLNVRKEASVKSEIVKTLKDGARILIKEAGEQWHKVTGGYVMAEYIAISKPDQTEAAPDEEADKEQTGNEG